MTDEIMEGLQASVETSLQQLTSASDISERKAIAETLKILADTVQSFLASEEILDELDLLEDFELEEEGGVPFPK
ncbi:MAG: hypothetical protein ACI8Z5_000329 [Lentimonas sp.]|jgi:hypothetical protein